MKFTSLTLAASSIAAVSASPLQKRELGGVLLCTGANATGHCTHETYELQKCHQLPAPFYTNTSTFAPDGEDFFCWPRIYNCGDPCFSPTGCTFGRVDFNYEHKYNLTAIGWNTLIRSFDCQQKTTN